MVNKAAELLREILFPRRCGACGAEIESGFLCPLCRSGMVQLRRCNNEAGAEEIVVLYGYEGAVQEAFHRIKFLGEGGLARRLGEEVCALWQEPGLREWLESFPGAGEWIWCGIPTDPERLRRRGFELPERLFRVQAERLGGQWEPQLCRLRKNRPMYGLGPEERRQNLEDCFGLIHDVRGKSIVLTDDIFTTGVTLGTAARLLRRAGAGRIRSMAFCGSVENLR